jgi:hypothetical protein
MSLPNSLLFNHSCMHAKRGGVAACRIVWIGLCLRSVPGVRVLASAVDDYVVHSTSKNIYITPISGRPVQRFDDIRGCIIQF